MVMCCCVESTIRSYKNIIANCNLSTIHKITIGVYIEELIDQLFQTTTDNVSISIPFDTDYGWNVKLGKNVYVYLHCLLLFEIIDRLIPFFYLCHSALYDLIQSKYLSLVHGK
jgi:hypothetical protein